MANKRYHPLTQSHGPSAALPSSMAYLRGGPRECDLIRTNCSLWSRKHAGTVSTWTARGSDLYLMPCGGTRPLPETPGPMGKHCCGCNSDVNSTKRVNGDISSEDIPPPQSSLCCLEKKEGNVPAVKPSTDGRPHWKQGAENNFLFYTELENLS